MQNNMPILYYFLLSTIIVTAYARLFPPDKNHYTYSMEKEFQRDWCLLMFLFWPILLPVMLVRLFVRLLVG